VKTALIKSPHLRLFVLSFLILFMELVYIRWLAANVLYLGYFTNFVLLGCFLGIGAGTLLGNRRTRLLNFLPLLLCVLFTIAHFSRAIVDPRFEGLVYYTSNTSARALPVYVLLPLIFISVTAIFTFLSQDLGVLLNEFAPLEAYRLNILGSLAGIACFTVMGLLGAPSWVWFLVAVLVLILLLPTGRLLVLNAVLLVGLVGAIGFRDYRRGNVWSPYSQLNLLVRQENSHYQVVRSPESPEDGPTGQTYALASNGIWHQTFEPIAPGEFHYELPYVAFDQKPVYENVLVIGAGGGNDVAYALANGATQVDAVEIDPVIVRLGRLYHPESPYADPRVTVHIQDGRAFLEQSTKKYDLVIFALTDSLVLASNSSNLRLESYLYTDEAFELVKSHLSSDGLFMAYNFYRQDWLANKIADMLTDVFGAAPVYHRPPTSDNPTVYVAFFAGPKAAQIDLQKPNFYQTDPQPALPATDNWPFLYLEKPSLPSLYIFTLTAILIGAALFIWRISPRGALAQGSLPFFFMGAAFTLLETKSIVNFLLLFGSTWLVNSLVFFGILLMVLVAIWLSFRFQFKKTWILYAVLFATILLNFLLPLDALLVDNLVVRYVLATVVLFSPIFVANLIYSSAFRDTPQASIAFGANLLGTIVGGAAEYLSLLTGYRTLSLLAGLFYVGAFIFFTRLQKQGRTSPAGR